MPGQEIRPEMMGQPDPEQMRSFEQMAPEEYKQQYGDQYRQQMEEQQRQQYEQQPTQEQQLQLGEPYQEPARQEETKESQPTGFKFGSGQLLGALVYTFFDLLFGK